MKEKIADLIVQLEASLNPHMTKAVADYRSEDGHFSDYDNGNFEDCLELGVYIGNYETTENIIKVLKEILNETN